MNFNDQGIYGFDLSLYQDNNRTTQQVDFRKMRDYGADFVVIKAGQWYYADPDFTYNWRESKGVLPRSAYWFCDTRSRGKMQAQLFWKLVKDDQPEGFLASDYETGSWTNWRELYNFLSELQQLSGYPSDRLPIYTGYPYWTANSPRTDGQLEWFAQFPLWLAWYTDKPSEVKVPRPWKEVFLWQDGTPPIGREAGVESIEIDHNKFNGDREKFNRYFKQVFPVPPKKKSVELQINGMKVYSGEF